MSGSSKDVQQERRAFLKGAAVTGVAAAVATVLDGRTVVPETQAASLEPRRDQGYQESAHVQAYYRTARI